MLLCFPLSFEFDFLDAFSVGAGDGVREDEEADEGDIIQIFKFDSRSP